MTHINSAEFIGSSARVRLIFRERAAIIRIKTADNDHEVSFYALSFYVQHYPIIKPLRQLQAVETKLEFLLKELMAGGKPEITAALDSANAQMKQQDSGFIPLSTDDLFTVQAANESKTIVFLRDQGNGRSIVITVVQAPNQQPKVTSLLQRN